jgi:hypothetical protein
MQFTCRKEKLFALVKDYFSENGLQLRQTIYRNPINTVILARINLL